MKIQNHEESLNAIADAIGISESMKNRAVSRCESINKWVKRSDSSIAQYNPNLYPQGSFFLETLIRPVGDTDEFDIDLVCLLNGNNGNISDFSMACLKELIGAELKAYADANSMKQKPEEKRRCWTMQYIDQAKFHLDILPALPKNKELGRSASLLETAIRITDKQHSQYNNHKFADWPVSDPLGYATWFYEKQGVCVNTTEVVYKNRPRTPLQKCIQLLKRHRDSIYGDHKDKPISIIITTLSAQAYQGKNTLKSALSNVLRNMHLFIKEDKGDPWIPNPVNPVENFADKWVEFPGKKRVFDEWLDKAKRDFGSYIDNAPFNEPPDSFIESMTEGTISKIKSEFKSLSTPAIKSVSKRASAEALYNKNSNNISKPWSQR